MPSINAFVGTMGFFGFGKEAVKGTAVPSSFWVPFTNDSLEHDPGVVSEKLIRRSRSVNIYPTIGQAKISGGFDAVLTIDNSLSLFCAGIGSDTYQTGGASSGSVSLSSNAAAGATSVSLATQTGTPIGVGDFIELRQTSGVAAATNLSEIHKVATVAGTGPYTITFAAGETLVNAYTSATATAYRIASGTTNFTHQVLPDQPTVTSWTTFTLEKYLAGLGGQSLQYAGGVLSKMQLKLDNKNPAKATYDFMCTAEAQIAPTSPTYPTSAPLYFFDYSATLWGAPNTAVQSIDYTLDNKGAAEWTFNGSNYASVTYPAEREQTVKIGVVAQDLTFYSDAIGGTTGALSLVMAQGSASITLTCPELIIKKVSNKMELGKVVLYDLECLGKLNAVAGNEVSATIVSAQWLPY